MFWKFNYLTSDLDNLLDKEDVTLQEVLNEDDVLQECKAQNKKLVDFLVRPANLDELFNCVLRTPADEENEKVKYKYPNIACELLTSDVTQITDALVGCDTLFDSLLRFLESDRPLNPLQASFYGKLVALLISRKGELVLDFLKSQEQFLDRVLYHLGTSAIMDLLLRLVTSMEPTESRNSCVQWLLDQRLVQRLVEMIDPSQSSETNSNAAQTICDLICITREQSTQQLEEPTLPDPLLTAIESQETVSELLNHMFAGDEVVDSVVTSGLFILQTLLEYRRLGPEGNLEPMTQADMERFSEGINNTVQSVVPRLKDFHQLLLLPPKQHYVPMPWTLGVLERPLGNARLQTVRLIATLLGTSSAAVSDELMQLGTVNVLLDLYFEYSWNNFLHRQVEVCLSSIITCESTDYSLLTQLITDFQLLEKVVKAFVDQQSGCSTNRPGYMGHLTRIANLLVNNAINSKSAQKLEDLILSLPASVQESWEQFKSGPLAEMNKKNTCELVPNIISSSSDTDEFSHLEFPQDNVNQKIGRTARLFGFDDDDVEDSEFGGSLYFSEQRSGFSPNSGRAVSEALFEDLCQRKLQFGGAEEDLWVEKEIEFSPDASPSSSGQQVAVDQMALDDVDSDDEKRGSFDDSSDEDLDSAPTIRQQPEPVVGQQQPQVESMDISSSDDWAKFDEAPMDVAPITAEPIPWESAAIVAGSTDMFAVGVSSTTTVSGSDNSWADFAGSTASNAAVTTTQASDDDDSGWADFASFDAAQPQSSSNSSASAACASAVEKVQDRMSAYVVSSSTDADIPACTAAPTVTDFVDSMSRVGSSSVPDELPSGDGIPIHGSAMQASDSSQT